MFTFFFGTAFLVASFYADTEAAWMVMMVNAQVWAAAGIVIHSLKKGQP